MVEGVHRTVKTALKCNNNPSAWYENLGLLLLGIRSMVKGDIGCSSSSWHHPALVRTIFSDNDDTVSRPVYRRRLVTFMKSLKFSLSREPCCRCSYLDKNSTHLHTCLCARRWFCDVVATGLRRTCPCSQQGGQLLYFRLWRPN